MKWTVIVLVMSLGLAGSTQAQAPDPIGEEFQVNSYTTSRQGHPRSGGRRPRRLRSGLEERRLGRYGPGVPAASRSSATTPTARPWGAVPGQLLHDGTNGHPRGG